MVQEFLWKIKGLIRYGVHKALHWMLWAVIKWAVVPVDAFVCGYHYMPVKAWIV